MQSPQDMEGAVDSLINHPIRFAEGQFIGKTVRAEVTELQKAELGRKYAKVDRRPLDPPPVAWLRFYIVHDEGTEKEREEEVNNYNEIQNLGLICTVDLYAASEPETEGPISRVPWSNQDPSSFAQAPLIPPVAPQPTSITFLPLETIAPGNETGSTTTKPNSGTNLQHEPASTSSSSTLHVTAERVKQTALLVGSTFVQAANVIYLGKPSLMFVFGDLAVKAEGTFLLRYRFFDLFSKAEGEPELTMLAECYGGKFRVYSTKDFPGLRESTELTKHLARWGVRLTIRETLREKKTKTGQGNPS